MTEENKMQIGTEVVIKKNGKHGMITDIFMEEAEVKYQIECCMMKSYRKRVQQFKQTFICKQEEIDLYQFERWALNYC